MRNTIKLLFLLALSGCQREGVSPNNNCPQASRFLPLQVGNRWEENDSTYVEVVGTRRFMGQNAEYFMLLSKRPFTNEPDTVYYRVDNDGVLIRYYPDSDFVEPITKFCTEQGERFTVRPEISLEFLSISTVRATVDTLSFEYNAFVACAGPGHFPCKVMYPRTYVRDIGWLESPSTGHRFTKATIGGRVRRL